MTGAAVDMGWFFVLPAQWSEWAINELNLLPDKARSEASRGLFYRWCCSHVSVDEVLQAVGDDLCTDLFSIHDRIKKNRADLLALGGK